MASQRSWIQLSFWLPAGPNTGSSIPGTRNDLTSACVAGLCQVLLEREPTLPADSVGRPPHDHGGDDALHQRVVAVEEAACPGRSDREQSYRRVVVAMVVIRGSGHGSDAEKLVAAMNRPRPVRRHRRRRGDEASSKLRVACGAADPLLEERRDGHPTGACDALLAFDERRSSLRSTQRRMAPVTTHGEPVGEIGPPGSALCYWPVQAKQ